MIKEKKHTVNLEYFKKYVETYDYTEFKYNETFIKDMIYGIGLAIDGENFEMADGYKRFEEFLLNEIINQNKEDDK
jgi:hypothetical protein